jgi:serine protease inhibitor
MKTSSIPLSVLTTLCFCLFVLSPFNAASQDSQALADANTYFGFDLLKRLVREQPDENIFISPFSISSTLQMAANGAGGQTKSEMLKVLRTDSMTFDQIDAAYKSINHSLTSQQGATLTLANAIWYPQGLQLKPTFVSKSTNTFNAGMASADFENPKAVEAINDWVNQNTHGKIQKIISLPLPPETGLILANAIYFKAKWEDPFDKNLTKPRDFHPAGGNVEQVPMMEKHQIYYSYKQDKSFQAIQLPYADSPFQMYLFCRRPIRA